MCSIESPVALRTGLKDGQLHSANCGYHKFWSQFARLLDLHAVIPLVNQRVTNSGSGRKPFSVIPLCVLRNEIRKVTGRRLMSCVTA